MNQVINLLNEANNAAKESEMFEHEGIYVTIREGENIRKRYFPCDVHKLDKKKVLELSYEIAHTLLKIKKRKQDKLNEQKDEKTADKV